MHEMFACFIICFWFTCVYAVQNARISKKFVGELSRVTDRAEGADAVKAFIRMILCSLLVVVAFGCTRETFPPFPKLWLIFVINNEKLFKQY